MIKTVGCYTNDKGVSERGARWRRRNTDPAREARNPGDPTILLFRALVVNDRLQDRRRPHGRGGREAIASNAARKRDASRSGGVDET